MTRRGVEIHRVEYVDEGGTLLTTTGAVDYHRGGGGSGGSCSWNEITGKPNFARVATTGSYNDLSNKPTIPVAYDDTALKARVTALEQSGGSGTSYDDTAIKARMTAAENRLNGLAAVATSGSYNDLSNKPTIPAAYDDTALRNRVTALENKTDQDTKPVLVSALTVNNAMGQATAGKTYPVGTSVEAILRDILTTGSTPTPTTEIKIYATVSSITSLDEINIQSTLNEYVLNVPAQTEENPVIIEVPAARGVKLTIWNPLTNQWVESPQKWNTASVIHDGVAYIRYTENCECGAAATRVRLSDWT